MNPSRKETKKCKYCNMTFQTKRSSTKICCNKTCAGRYRNQIADRTGMIHGANKVLGRSHIKPRKGGDLYYWFCECTNCHKIKTIDTSHLTRNTGCLNCSLRPKGESGFTKLLHDYHANSRTRRHEFDLSDDQFKKLTSNNCYYCGSPPTLVSKGGARNSSKRSTWGDYIYNGIDRKDNAIGYTANNCVSCCCICNKAKLSMSFDKFKAYIIRIRTNVIPMLEE